MAPAGPADARAKVAELLPRGGHGSKSRDDLGSRATHPRRDRSLARTGRGSQKHLSQLLHDWAADSQQKLSQFWRLEARDRGTSRSVAGEDLVVPGWCLLPMSSPRGGEREPSGASYQGTNAIHKGPILTSTGDLITSQRSHPVMSARGGVRCQCVNLGDALPQVSGRTRGCSWGSSTCRDVHGARDHVVQGQEGGQMPP